MHKPVTFRQESRTFVLLRKYNFKQTTNHSYGAFSSLYAMFSYSEFCSQSLLLSFMKETCTLSTQRCAISGSTIKACYITLQLLNIDRQARVRAHTHTRMYTLMNKFATKTDIIVLNHGNIVNFTNLQS